MNQKEAFNLIDVARRFLDHAEVAVEAGDFEMAARHAKMALMAIKDLRKMVEGGKEKKQ